MGSIVWLQYGGASSRLFRQLWTENSKGQPPFQAAFFPLVALAHFGLSGN